jgi:hypothetical protein
VVSDLQTSATEYEYDPLYRLTETLYTGDITATYSYVYDSVGNTTACTDTVGVHTTIVNRTFDAANRLQTALDSELGTSSYYFDVAGNPSTTQGKLWLRYCRQAPMGRTLTAASVTATTSATCSSPAPFT